MDTVVGDRRAAAAGRRAAVRGAPPGHPFAHVYYDFTGEIRLKKCCVTHAPMFLKRRPCCMC